MQISKVYWMQIEEIACFDLLVERKFLVGQRRALRHVENAQIIRHLRPCAADYPLPGGDSRRVGGRINRHI